jgi:hypothetical protein
MMNLMQKLRKSFLISYCSYCKQKLLSCSLETSKNLDKFVELDVVKRVNNLVNPYLELFAFNYKTQLCL